MTVIVIAAVSVSLIVGAFWGVFRPPAERTEGVMLACAGGALVAAVMTDLVMPASDTLSLGLAMGFVALGGVTFVHLDQWIERRFSSSKGFGLWLAITLDGVPEMLALGVVLVAASPLEAAALIVSVVLSNVPEAAGGARQMRGDGRTPTNVMTIWCLTAVALLGAAWLGFAAFAHAPPEGLAMIKCFAAGAVSASLAVEIFPRAFRESDALTGYGVTAGLIVAYVAGALGAG